MFSIVLDGNQLLPSQGAVLGINVPIHPLALFQRTGLLMTPAELGKTMHHKALCFNEIEEVAEIVAQ